MLKLDVVNWSFFLKIIDEILAGLRIPKRLQTGWRLNAIERVDLFICIRHSFFHLPGSPQLPHSQQQPDDHGLAGPDYPVPERHFQRLRVYRAVQVDHRLPDVQQRGRLAAVGSAPPNTATTQVRSERQKTLF